MLAEGGGLRKRFQGIYICCPWSGGLGEAKVILAIELAIGWMPMRG